MKALFYALILLAVLVASVLLLYPLDKTDRVRPGTPAGTPVVESEAFTKTVTIRDDLEDAAPVEIYAVGMELLNLWHVREAAGVFEMAAAADSSFYPAWVGLVECYSHPLVGREDGARTAWTRAWDTRLSEADTTYLKGLRELFVEGDYQAAAHLLGRAEKSEVSHEDAVYYHALALYRAGITVEASRILEDLLNRDDTMGRVVELSINCALARGENETAEERARNLAQDYSEEPHPYVLLARVALRRGKISEAVEFCNNALVLDAKYIPAIITRANLYAAEHRLEPARVSFEKCLLFEDPVVRAAGMEGIAFVDFLAGDFDDGVSAMDEAIRYAVLGGSVRKGLFYAYRLIEYLCELGQRDTADAVVDRWVTGFGDIPVALGKMRIQILDGELEKIERLLPRMREDEEWTSWMNVLGIDSTAIRALFHISADDHKAALEVLGDDNSPANARLAARAFLRGYSSFEIGDAEAAGRSFAEVAGDLFTVEFPYHDNPVLYVQSLFYLGETYLAAGREADARARYESFLDYWGEASWEIHAVSRAREKLQNMTGNSGG